MSWTEVHDEAEHLEHAVSERLIDRIDEMLGRPAVDPHGDPIPDPDGTVSRMRYDTLLTCPLHTAVTVQRVSDQDPEFLRFVERHELKPGQVVEVEERDDAADSVQLRAEEPRDIHDRRARRVEGAGAGRARHGAAAAARDCRPSAQSAGQAQSRSATARRSESESRSGSRTTRSSSRRRSTRSRGSSRTSSARRAATASGRRPSPRSGRSSRRRTSFPTRSRSWMATLRSAVGDTLLNYRYQAVMEGPGPTGVLAARQPRAPDRQRRGTAAATARTACRSTCLSASGRATSTGIGTRASHGCRGARRTGPGRGRADPITRT